MTVPANFVIVVVSVILILSLCLMMLLPWHLKHYHHHQTLLVSLLLFVIRCEFNVPYLSVRAFICCSLLLHGLWAVFVWKYFSRWLRTKICTMLSWWVVVMVTGRQTLSHCYKFAKCYKYSFRSFLLFARPPLNIPMPKWHHNYRATEKHYSREVRNSSSSRRINGRVLVTRLHGEGRREKGST